MIYFHSVTLYFRNDSQYLTFTPLLTKTHQTLKCSISWGRLSVIFIARTKIPHTQNKLKTTPSSRPLVLCVRIIPSHTKLFTVLQKMFLYTTTKQQEKDRKPIDLKVCENGIEKNKNTLFFYFLIIRWCRS